MATNNGEGKHMVVPVPVIQAVVDYLQEQPYKSVRHLIEVLVQAPLFSPAPLQPPAPKAVEAPAVPAAAAALDATSTE